MNPQYSYSFESNIGAQTEPLTFGEIICRVQFSDEGSFRKIHFCCDFLVQTFIQVLTMNWQIHLKAIHKKQNQTLSNKLSHPIFYCNKADSFLVQFFVFPVCILYSLSSQILEIHEEQSYKNTKLRHLMSTSFFLIMMKVTLK